MKAGVQKRFCTTDSRAGLVPGLSFTPTVWSLSPWACVGVTISGVEKGLDHGLNLRSVTDTPTQDSDLSRRWSVHVHTCYNPHMHILTLVHASPLHASTPQTTHGSYMCTLMHISHTSYIAPYACTIQYNIDESRHLTHASPSTLLQHTGITHTTQSHPLKVLLSLERVHIHWCHFHMHTSAPMWYGTSLDAQRLSKHGTLCHAHSFPSSYHL